MESIGLQFVISLGQQLVQQNEAYTSSQRRKVKQVESGSHPHAHLFNDKGVPLLSKFKKQVEQTFTDVEHEQLREHLMEKKDAYIKELWQMYLTNVASTKTSSKGKGSNFGMEDFEADQEGEGDNMSSVNACQETGDIFMNTVCERSTLHLDRASMNKKWMEESLQGLTLEDRLMALAHLTYVPSTTADTFNDFEALLLELVSESKMNQGSITPATVSRVVRLIVARCSCAKRWVVSGQMSSLEAFACVLTSFQTCATYFSVIPSHLIAEGLASSMANFLVGVYISLCPSAGVTKSAFSKEYTIPQQQEQALLRSKRKIVDLVLRFAIVELRVLSLPENTSSLSSGVVQDYIGFVSTTIVRLKGMSLARIAMDFVRLLLLPIDHSSDRFKVAHLELLLRVPSVLEKILSEIVSTVPRVGMVSTFSPTKNPLIALKIVKSLRKFDQLAKLLVQLNNFYASSKDNLLSEYPTLASLRSAILSIGKVLKSYAQLLSSLPLPQPLVTALERHFELNRALQSSQVDIVEAEAEKQIAAQYGTEASMKDKEEKNPFKDELAETAKKASEEFGTFASLLKTHFGEFLSRAIALLRVQKIKRDAKFAKDQAESLQRKFISHQKSKTGISGGQKASRSPLAVRAWQKLADDYESAANSLLLDKKGKPIEVANVLDEILIRLTDLMDGPLPGSPEWHAQMVKRRESLVEEAKKRRQEQFNRLQQIKSELSGKRIEESKAASINDDDDEGDEYSLPNIDQFMKLRGYEDEANDSHYEGIMNLADASDLFYTDMPMSAFGKNKKESNAAEDSRENDANDVDNDDIDNESSDSKEQKLEGEEEEEDDVDNDNDDDADFTDTDTDNDNDNEDGSDKNAVIDEQMDAEDDDYLTEYSDIKTGKSSMTVKDDPESNSEEEDITIFESNFSQVLSNVSALKDAGDDGGEIMGQKSTSKGKKASQQKIATKSTKTITVKGKARKSK